jgi:hypothetical protein
LVGADLRSSHAAERDDWSATVEPVVIAHAGTRDRLAATWLRDALEEHASVAAFARFALLLLSVGAPPELVALAQRASLDEIEHARACFGLARRYGAKSGGPSRLLVADCLEGVSSLADLVELTVTEGCVGETLGALLAAEQLAHASDPAVLRTLKRIAADEARHAELSWRFLTWAFATGDDEVQYRARRAFERAAAEIAQTTIVDYAVDIALWHAHGRLTCAESRASSQHGLETVVWPCFERAIAGESRSAEPSRETPAHGDH